MPESNLNKSIADLNTELAQQQPTDKTQAIADDLKSHVQPIIDTPDADHSDKYQTLGERLNLALVDLDVDHPRLSGAIQSVLNELSAVGI